MNKDLKILTLDCETSPMRAWIWHLGEQVVRHDQLDPIHSFPDIMCIGYKWMHEREVHILTWDKDHDSRAMIAAFDEVIKKADIVVGQNSVAFDVKHINTQRFLHGLAPLPDWAGVTMADTLKMARKYFAFPSNKLDYFSKTLLGTGGKIDMKLQDWIDIVEWNPGWDKKWDKMLKYLKKDVRDAEALYKALQAHAKPVVNMSAIKKDPDACVSCGSKAKLETYQRARGTVMYQYYACEECNKYAGKRRISDKGVTGKRSI